ncbi:hypothetical protein ACWC2T_33695 [Streptomyces sp. NPDC001393]
MELRRSERDALRLYVHLGAWLRVPPADGLKVKVRTARQLGSLGVLYLNTPASRWAAGGRTARAEPGLTPLSW